MAQDELLPPPCPDHFLHLCFLSVSNGRLWFGLQLYPSPTAFWRLQGSSELLMRRVVVSSQTTVPADFWSTYLWA